MWSWCSMPVRSSSGAATPSSSHWAGATPRCTRAGSATPRRPPRRRRRADLALFPELAHVTRFVRSPSHHPLSRSLPMPDPVRVAITGAAGQIGYSLLFRVARGHLLGPDQPVILHLLEITPALDALKGVAMELEDCAFPLLSGIVQTDDPNVAFRDVNYALLVGARPRSKGMERKDLLEANGAIFTVQGKALSDNAAAGVRILVVGNPANTNALIAMNNAPNIDNGRFTAMTRLDHNRALAQLAAKTGTTVNDITKMTIWGNHSATQYPDLFHAEVNG